MVRHNITWTYLELLTTWSLQSKNTFCPALSCVFTVSFTVSSNSHPRELLFLNSENPVFVSEVWHSGFSLLRTSHNGHKFSSFWWSNLGRQTVSSCLEIRAAVSSLPAEHRVECWSFKTLSAHPGRTEGKGKGGAEGGVLLPVEPKVKGCHRPANGDEELTLNLTLPVELGEQWWEEGVGCVHCLPGACLLLKRQKPSVAHWTPSLSHSFSLFSPPFALPPFLAFPPIC